jgi:hypothetical protein
MAGCCPSRDNARQHVCAPQRRLQSLDGQCCRTQPMSLISHRQIFVYLFRLNTACADTLTWIRKSYKALCASSCKGEQDTTERYAPVAAEVGEQNTTERYASVAAEVGEQDTTERYASVAAEEGEQDTTGRYGASICRGRRARHYRTLRVSGCKGTRARHYRMLRVSGCKGRRARHYRTLRRQYLQR